MAEGDVNNLLPHLHTPDMILATTMHASLAQTRLMIPLREMSKHLSTLVMYA